MALRVGVAGLGTVGGGICQILKSNAPLIAARCGGRAVELAAVADIVKPEGLDISGATFYDDAVAMASEADIDVVVETIGGYGIALTVAEKALESSKSIVTANKAMLAIHGPRLAATAEQNGVTIGCVRHNQPRNNPHRTS